MRRNCFFEGASEVCFSVSSMRKGRRVSPTDFITALVYLPERIYLEYGDIWKKERKTNKSRPLPAVSRPCFTHQPKHRRCAGNDWEILGTQNKL